MFLAFVKPIINGVGFYLVEPQTRTNRRMDIVITYNKKRYIIELKLWKGEKYEEKGIHQLVDYLNINDEDKGYLLVFSFNKNKEYINNWIKEDGKDIFEVIV